MSKKRSLSLHCRDCLDVLHRVHGVDMVLTDLSFGETHNAWDRPLDLDHFWSMMIESTVKPTTSVIHFASMKFASKLIPAAEAAGWRFRYDLVWEKNKSTGFLNAKKMPMRAHEMLLVFYRKLGTFNPQFSDGHRPMNAALRTSHGTGYGRMTRRTRSDAGTTKRYPRSVVPFPIVNNDDPDKVHAAQKPVELLRWLIESYTNPGDLVLDPCMGSGSTGEAALACGRRFVGIEIDRDIFGQAKRRLHRAKRRYVIP